jgi:hypothetical protein
MISIYTAHSFTVGTYLQIQIEYVSFVEPWDLEWDYLESIENRREAKLVFDRIYYLLV